MKSFTGSCYYYDLADLKSISRKIGAIADLATPDTTISRLSYDSLDHMLFMAEKLALTCRNHLKDRDKPLDYNPLFKQIIPSFCTVEIKDGALIVKTPLTFKRMYRDRSLKENYTLCTYVAAAIYDFREEHRKEVQKIIEECPLTIMLKRKKIKYIAQYVCDNDNLENGRIINAIFNGLGLGDAADVVDYFSCFRAVDDEQDEGMEFILFPTKDLVKHQKKWC